MVSENKIYIENIDTIASFKRPKTSTTPHEPSLTSPFSVLQNLKKFCGSTALHGCCYIVKNDLNIAERFGWLLLVLAAIITSIALLWISSVWNMQIPNVTVIESTHFSTLHVPFPAVTICSINRISKRKAYALAEKLKKPDNMTTDELAKLFVTPLDFAGILHTEESNYLKLGEILSANNILPVMLMEMLVPSCNEIFISCIWRGNKVHCSTLFQLVNTTEGLCCSFNYHALKKSNFEDRYAYAIPKKPYRFSSSGHFLGLTVVLDPDPFDYFGTYLSSYGFRVLLHNSYDYADPNAEIKVLPLNSENFIGILPQSSYATKGVLGKEPEARGCMLPNEREMNVLKRYSYVNCMAECRAALVYRLCGCLPMRFASNGSLPSCRMDQVFCIAKNLFTINGAIPGLNETILRNFHSQSRPCGCLPDCEFIMYPSESASADLIKPDPTDKYDNWGGVVKNTVIAHVYYSDLVSTRYRKDFFQNWVDVAASFGGLMGLAMGSSIITTFEFVYFLIIRPFFDWTLVRTRGTA